MKDAFEIAYRLGEVDVRAVLDLPDDLLDAWIAFLNERDRAGKRNDELRMTNDGSAADSIRNL